MTAYNMIITTTNSIEGYEIEDYLGIVSSEVVNGINFIKDIGTSFRNIIGGRTENFESEIVKAKKICIEELEERASSMNADAILGVKIDVETLVNGGMILVNAIGTAVKLK